METNYLKNNSLTLVGKVTGEKRFSHEIYGEKFYVFDLVVPRLSGQTDIIPITVSERLLTKDMLEKDNTLMVTGQFRSYNSITETKNRLILTVFAKDIVDVPETEENEEDSSLFKKDEITNEVVLNGYICKKPIYRQTPFGREIADILLAVNRAYNKSDYLPCIAWGRNARFCKDIEVGTQVIVTGRIQSRNYDKKLDDDTIEKRTAYEISIGSLEVVKDEKEENNDNNDQETETLNV